MGSELLSLCASRPSVSIPVFGLTRRTGTGKNSLVQIPRGDPPPSLLPIPPSPHTLHKSHKVIP